MQICRNKNLELNKNKYQLGFRKVSFFGEIISTGRLQLGHLHAAHNHRNAPFLRTKTVYKYF